MALSPRQRRLYAYTAEIWRMGDEDVDFPAYALLSTVPCYFESTPEADQPGAVGRSKELSLLTLDYFHMDIAVDVRDTDFLRLTGGPAGSLTGNWWAVQGNTRTHGFHANKQVVYAKQTVKPRGAP